MTYFVITKIQDEHGANRFDLYGFEDPEKAVAAYKYKQNSSTDPVGMIVGDRLEGAEVLQLESSLHPDKFGPFARMAIESQLKRALDGAKQERIAAFEKFCDGGGVDLDLAHQIDALDRKIADMEAGQ